MAKLYFRYSTMNSSKTAHALMVAFNYHERGKKALLVKPVTDNREGTDPVISSRIGISMPAVFSTDFAQMTDEQICAYDCIVVDECQFLAPEEIDRFADIADRLNVPVICYGLRTDFQARLFPGSRRLFELADQIEEIKTICWCGRKAIINARIMNGKILTDGPQVLIGGNDSYVALCRKHWRAGDLGPRK